MLLYAFFAACILTAIENFLLGPLVYKLNRSDLTRRWFYLCLSVGLWSAGFGAVVITSDASLSFNFARSYYTGVILIPITYFHFAMALINRVRAKIKLLRAGYLIAAFFIIVNFSGGLITSVSPKFIFRNTSDPGFFFPFLIIYFLFYVSYAFFLELKTFLSSSGYERSKLAYILVASIIGFTGGGAGFFLAYDVFPVVSFGMYAVWIYPLIVAYSVATAHLMDIEIFVHRTTRAVIGITVYSLALYLSYFIFEGVFRRLLGKVWYLAPLMVFGIGLVLLVFFVKHVFKMNEEDLSSKFSYRPILKELARRTARASNLDELFAYFTRFTSAYAGLEYFGVLLLDKERDNYTLIRSLNRTKRREKILPGLKLSCTNPLIRTLKSQRTVLNISSIKFDLRKKDLSFNRRKDLLRLKREMQRFGVKLVVPCFSEDQLLSVFLLGDKSNREMFVPKDEDLFLTIADQLAKPIHNFIHKREAIEGFIRSQDVVIRAVEAKDPYTRGHSERVAEISFIIGEKLGLEAAQLEYLKFAARLHDIGKIAIKDEILHKEGKLTPEEYAKVKEHPIESVKMIQPIASQLGRDAIEAIMHHHENLNGTGYPSGQKDGDIHMFAKIIRCADSLDALVTIRPYRKRKTHIEAVLEELNKNKGIEFDPLIVDTITVLCRDREFVLWLKHLIEKSGAVCRLVIE